MNARLLLVVCRKELPMLSNSQAAQFLFFRTRLVRKMCWIQASIFVFVENVMHDQLDF